MPSRYGGASSGPLRSSSYAESVGSAGSGRSASPSQLSRLASPRLRTESAPVEDVPKQHARWQTQLRGVSSRRPGPPLRSPSQARSSPSQQQQQLSSPRPTDASPRQSARGTSQPSEAGSPVLSPARRAALQVRGL